MSEPERIEAVETDNYAFRIEAKGVDIRIYADGRIEGWEVVAGEIIVHNKIPAMLAAAEELGYTLGFTSATPVKIINEELDGCRKQEG